MNGPPFIMKSPPEGIEIYSSCRGHAEKSAAGQADFDRMCTKTEEAEAKLLLSCIEMRAAYGGMAGDVSMLHAYTQLWQRR